MPRSVVSIIRNLQRRNARRRLPLAVLEGVRLVEEALDAGVPFLGLVVSNRLEDTERGSELRRAAAERSVPEEEVPDEELARLADTMTPQGVLAVVELRDWSVDDLVVGRNAPVMVLDGVQDPGNVGTVIRTAYGLGAAGVLLLPGTARLTNPKVLRATMGASFRMPVVPLRDDDLVAWLRHAEMVVWAADPHGKGVTQLKPADRLSIIVGNEGAGVRSELAALASERVAIPLARGVESLNAAVAAGIILHEVVRDS